MNMSSEKDEDDAMVDGNPTDRTTKRENKKLDTTIFLLFFFVCTAPTGHKSTEKRTKTTGEKKEKSRLTYNIYSNHNVVRVKKSVGHVSVVRPRKDIAAR